MKYLPLFKGAAFAALFALLGFSCATKETSLPPLKVAKPAASPAEVLQALPGVWVIDVEASADALARMPYQPRETSVLRREEHAGDSHQTTAMAERFDVKAYREARSYWLELLGQPDMRWRLAFRTNGTGEHYAVIKAGAAPQATPFTWRLDGWRLHVDYPPDSRFHSFEVEMPAATELNYPMKPIGDHLVLRRQQSS